MGMFSENYSGCRCTDCTWADNMEEKLNSIQLQKAKISEVLDSFLRTGGGQYYNWIVTQEQYAELRKLSAI